MAKFANVNVDTTNNSGAAGLFNLQETLVAAGWVVKMSSDGTTYRDEAWCAINGSQITQAGANANGMNNASAWFRIQDPGGRREMTVMRCGSAVNGRVKWSALGQFTGGSPAATVTPTATDEHVLVGGAGDSAPYGDGLFSQAGTYKNHCIAQSTPEGGVYAFYFFSTLNGTGTGAGCGLTCEPMAVGSYPIEDTDPCVIAYHSYSDIFAPGFVGYGYYKQGLAGETWIDYTPLGYASLLDGSSYHMGANPYTGEDDAFALAYGRSTGLAQPGWKGCSKFLRRSSVLRYYPDTVNLATDAYVYRGACLVPWPENIAPQL